jgi:hypothetical protein
VRSIRLALVVGELAAAGMRLADPLPAGEVEPFRGRHRDVAQAPRVAHHVADPAELHVLLLQEVVVRELGGAPGGDARRHPVALDPQALGQGAVIEVLAVPGTALRHPVDDHARDEEREEEIDHQVQALEVRVGDEGEAHQGRERIDRLQGPGDLRLVMDGEDVGGHEHRVHRRGDGGHRGGRVGGQQRPAAALDALAKAQHVAIELRGAVEDALVGGRHLPCPRRLVVRGVPPGLQRLEPLRGRAVGPAARADHVVDEVALVLREDLDAALVALHEAGHLVPVVKAHHLRRAAELPRLLAVPDRQQDVAVRAEIDAEPRVVRVAPRAVLRDGLGRVAREEGQLDDLSIRAQRAERLDRAGRAEVPLVDLDREGQRHDQRNPQRPRLLGDHAVGALGERTHDRDRQVGILLAQRREELAHAPPQCRNLRGHDVAMPRDPDDDRHQVLGKASAAGGRSIAARA